MACFSFGTKRPRSNSANSPHLKSNDFGFDLKTQGGAVIDYGEIARRARRIPSSTPSPESRTREGERTAAACPVANRIRRRLASASQKATCTCDYRSAHLSGVGGIGPDSGQYFARKAFASFSGIRKPSTLGNRSAFAPVTRIMARRMDAGCFPVCLASIVTLTYRVMADFSDRCQMEIESDQLQASTSRGMRSRPSQGLTSLRVTSGTLDLPAEQHGGNVTSLPWSCARPNGVSLRRERLEAVRSNRAGALRQGSRLGR